MLLIVFLYTFFSGKLGYEPRAAIMPKNLFYISIGLCLGFYDGFFGPGTGSFWTAAFVVLLGFDMTRAAGFTRIMNFTSNIVALLLFICGNKIIYSAGLCMAAGQAMGAFMGSRLAVKKGAAFIRPVFMSVILVTIIRLIYIYIYILLFLGLNLLRDGWANLSQDQICLMAVYIKIIF